MQSWRSGPFGGLRGGIDYSVQLREAWRLDKMPARREAQLEIASDQLQFMGIGHRLFPARQIAMAKG